MSACSTPNRAEGRQRVFRAAVGPDLSGLLVATGYFAILTEWITAEPAPFDLEARLRETVSILCRGLSSASR